MAFGEDDRYLVHGHSLGLEQIRVPLLWRPPRFSQAGGETSHAASERPAPMSGRQILRPVSTLAVAPTLLAAGGIPVSGAISGPGLPFDPSEATSDRIEPLFAEHPQRIALVAGSHYYARDRAARLLVGTGSEDGEPVLDPDALLRANARVAQLWTPSSDEESELEASRRASSQQLPPYEPARPTGIAPYLEPLVADFIAIATETGASADDR
jgi:hypothetical protein